jgi:hypothetical protein
METLLPLLHNGQKNGKKVDFFKSILLPSPLIGQAAARSGSGRPIGRPRCCDPCLTGSAWSWRRGRGPPATPPPPQPAPLPAAQSHRLAAQPAARHLQYIKTKEDVKEQSTSRILSATATRFLQCTVHAQLMKTHCKLAAGPRRIGIHTPTRE